MPEWSRKLFDKAQHSAKERNTKYGLLGKHNADDTVDFEVAGRVDFLFVTMPNGTVTIARNEAGVPQTEDLQVKLELDHGTWVILGRSTKGNLSVPTETPPSGVLAHTIEEHSDAAIVAAATGDLLEYSAGHWINAATIPVAQAATIHAATSKTPPVDADELGLVDSAASNVLKKLTWANLKATIKTYYDSLATTLTNKTLDSTNISSLTAKTTPVDADSAVIVDSAASNVFKRVTYTNVKAFLKTYFDTLYDLTGTAITALATKSTPVDADDIVITDSAASNVPKRVTGTNYKAYFKTYFDTLYNLYVHPNHSGDVTSVGDGATTIANNVVTNAKLAQHPAMTVLANNVAITANIIDLSATGGTDAVLRESGSNIGWGTIATGALGGNIVTNAKLATMAANTVKSNITGSTANAADNDIATVLAQYIHGATGKTTPVSADELALIDSAASNVLKKLTYANLLATLTTAFNALYGALAAATNAWTGNQWFGISSLTRTAPVATNTILYVETLNTDAIVQIWQDTADALGPIIAIGKSRGTAVQSNTVVQSGDVLGQINWYGADGGGATAALAAYIRALCDGTPGNNDMPTRLEFATSADGSAAPSLAALITSTQQVVIGGLTSAGASGSLATKAGTSSNDAAVGGVLYTNITTVGNVLTGEDDLMTYSIPADTLHVNGQSIEFEALFKWAATGANKTIKLYFGATVIRTIVNNSGLAGNVLMKGTIYRTGATSQIAIAYTVDDVSGTIIPIWTTPAETLSGAVIIKATGTATNTNDITQTVFKVKWDDANT